MGYEDYLARRRQDPEYREVEKRLKPILDLADDVFNLRMARGWTQAELAKRVGTRQANISRLENGLANPTFKFLEKLSEVFDTELVVRLRPQPAEEHLQVVQVRQVVPVHFYVDAEEYVELFSVSATNVPLQHVASRIVDQEIVMG